jgi:hypothetical protein
LRCDNADGEFPNFHLEGNELSVVRFLGLIREESSYYTLCGTLNGILEEGESCDEEKFHLPCRLLNSGRPDVSPLLQWLSF